MTTDATIVVAGDQTSGEAELCLVGDGDDLFVTLASDHTDRAAEAIDIELSKAICPVPVATRGVAGRRRSTVTGTSSCCAAGSTTDDGEVALPGRRVRVAGAAARPARRLSRAPARNGFVMLTGTVPVIGAIRPERRTSAAELHDPVRGRSITLDYRIDALAGGDARISGARSDAHRSRTTSQSLDDGRNVMLDGETVDDVADPPGVSPEPSRTLGPPLRRRRRPGPPRPVHLPVADRRRARAPCGGRRRVVPDDLAARRHAIAAWAEETCGFLGRSPDHVASFFAGFAGSLRDCSPRAASSSPTTSPASTRRRATRASTSATRSSTRPSTGPSRRTSSTSPNLYVSVLDERDDGIVLRGAQMLGHRFGDERLHLRQLHPAARPGSEDYAISVVVPNNAAGPAHLLPPVVRRRATPAGSTTRCSTRFDETDSLVVFDDVFVPWEHVFVYRNIELTSAQFNRMRGALPRQHAGPDPLRHQAALLRRPGPSHRRRQRDASPTRRRSCASASSPPSARSPRPS